MRHKENRLTDSSQPLKMAAFSRPGCYKMIHLPKFCNEDGTVNYDELEKLLRKVIDELERR